MDEVKFMWRSRIKNQRGQALVEMALVLPILLLIVFGIIEFGRIYTYQLQINSFARLGARTAAVGVPDADGHFNTLENDIEDMMIGATADIRKIDSNVKAKVDYSVQLYAGHIIGFSNDTLKLTAEVTMRAE